MLEIWKSASEIVYGYESAEFVYPVNKSYHFIVIVDIFIFKYLKYKIFGVLCCWEKFIDIADNFGILDIPDGYIYIGTKNGYLTKESDKTYKFNGDCSSDINDIIRFSPEKAWWKAEMKYSLESSSKFIDNALFKFPRLYRGGKLRNALYEISSLDDEIFNEEDLIVEDIQLEVEVEADEDIVTLL